MIFHDACNIKMKNNNELLVVAVVLNVIFSVKSEDCNINCTANDEHNMVCAFDIKKRIYRMFPSRCAMQGYSRCHDADFVRTPLRYCIKEHFLETRRVYGESCPVFCPNHYSPVCGASKFRDYIYRTFNNGCYLDMLNCRGDDDYTGYVEVPLKFCQRHLMKNIFKEQVLVSNMYDYRDYN